jgi:amino acid adenylation domain-containing protein
VSAHTPVTIWEAAASYAERTGRAAALRGTTDITYGELARRAAKLADAISAKSGPGTLVTLEARSVAVGVLAYLAASLARRALLPLAADSPTMLRQAVIRDARPTLRLSEEHDGTLTVAPLPAGDGAVPRNDMQDIAYVMYTSGSTGRPKGVMIPHAALWSRLRALAAIPGLRPGESMAAMTALSFDISIAELLLPLAVGGQVIAAPPEARQDPAIFAAFAAEHSPDVIQATPSFWRLALAAGWRGAEAARVWSGGEALTPGLADRLLPLCGELWNLYGPTEATIWATADRVMSPVAISLGQPLPGSGLAIGTTDHARRPVTASWQPGEILLYGEGLATGYLNDERLTAERFCAYRTNAGTQLCYRTGDLAQYRDDGSVEFLGRLDQQVKLRGHRIELGGVEAVLEECPGVSQAVVLLRDADRPERAQLAAFLATEGPVTVREVRRWAAERLPQVMRPGQITLAGQLPRTAAGKVDRILLARRLEQQPQPRAGT